MSHGTDATVECPLCGAAFGPSVSGGWCTDSACGARRQDGATDSRRRLLTDGGTAEGERDEDAEEKPDVAEVWPDDEDDESASTDDGDAGGEDEATESPDDGASEHDDGTVACPACETEIDVEDNFCRVCGADVSGIDDSGRLVDCPSCGTEADPDDSYCRECGEHLDAHRPGTDDSAPAGAGRSRVTGGQQAGSPGTARAGGQSSAAGDGTGASAGGAANTETVKGDGSAAKAAEAGGAEPADDEPRLSLVARNREVTVTDGDVVGKEIRSIIMDTGGDEEDAVRVHREHVRFEREDDQFYLVALGKNPTVVNGEELEQGDRAPVEPGDRIDLSGVARIGVRQG